MAVRMFSFIVILSIMVGCNVGGFRSAKNITIDSEFMPYVDTFVSRYHVEVTSSIVFKDIPEEYIAGQCWYSKEPRLIEIDTPYWNEISELGREELILHELGHCVLDLEHDNRIGNVGVYRGVPLSIMYPVHFGDEPYYEHNREYYLQELYP